MDGPRYVSRAFGLLLASFASLASVLPAHAVQFTYSGTGGSGTPGWVDAFTVAPGSTVAGTVSVTLNQGDSLCNPGPFLGGSGRAQCEGFWNNAFIAPAGSSYANGAASISGLYGGTIGAQLLPNGTFVPYQPAFGTVGPSTLPFSGYVLAPASAMNGYDLFSKTSSGANQTYSALQIEVATAGNTTIKLDWNVQSNAAPYGAPAPLTSQAAAAAGLPTVSGSYWAKPGPLAGGAYLCNGPCPTYRVTPPPTVYELERLAFDSYNSSPAGLAPYTVLNSVTGANGFGATAYMRGDPVSGQQIVISARGTSSVDDASHAYTVLADTSYANTNGTPNFALQSEVQQFANFVDNTATQNPGAQITVTGYSLGGGIAQIVGHYANVQTVTFDAPGSAAFLGSFSSLSSLSSLAISSPSTGNWEYRLQGDQVSLVGQQVGETITAINPLMTTSTGESTGLPYAIFPQAFIDQFHSEQLLDAEIVDAPSAPGDLSNPEFVLGEPDQNLVNQLVDGAVVGGYTTLYQTDVANSALSFDPGPGYGYSLAIQSSPNISLLQLPVGINLDGQCITGWAGACVAGWDLSYQTAGGQSGTLFSANGQFSLVPGIDQLDFNPVDQIGNPVLYADPFIFSLAFDGTGPFSATLTTDPNPLTGSPVPEPGSDLLFGAAVGCFGLMRRSALSRRPALPNSD